MPAAYLLLRLPDFVIGLLGFTTISAALACGSDTIQITTFIVSSVEVSCGPVLRAYRELGLSLAWQ